MQLLPQPNNEQPLVEGIRLAHCNTSDCSVFFKTYGVQEGLQIEILNGQVQCQMDAAWMRSFTPNCSTLSLHLHAENLKQEILWSMLVSPHGFQFNHLDALASAVRVRENIAIAARKTAVAFKTEAAERPTEFWRYEEHAGFILQSGTSLIKALICATQPDATGRLFDFSCYRASEYVILLGLAQEAEEHNPALLHRLQQLNEKHAVRSGQFHDVFLHEYGSLETPLPPHFFVPGDRLWFRNPNEPSSDVTGYEGSWVIYMGEGLFSNFWKRDQPFTLLSKCLEIYHWRDGFKTHENGEAWMDEVVVEACVANTLQQPDKLEAVLSQMMRMRDPKGVYAEGGCLDATRECPKQIHPTHDELVLPQIP
jgi:hypothetical protein